MAGVTFIFVLILTAAFHEAVNAQACNTALGISDGTIPDSSFAATSTQRWHVPSLARLNQQPPGTPGAWCSEDGGAVTPRIWVDLGKLYKITKIAIQGRNSSYSGMFTKEFKLYYNAPPSTAFVQSFSPGALGIYAGNRDKTSVVEHDVDFVGQIVSILPTSYYPTKMACLRFELYGCLHVVDPCSVSFGGCQQICTTVSGKAVCSCHDGYRLNGNNKCEDIDECTDAIVKHKCDKATTTCKNKVQGYDCQCKEKGFFNDPGNIYRCIDINECDIGNGGCSQTCNNSPGSYSCSCKKGYLLKADNKTCEDIDECKLGTDNCDKTTTQCKNTIGSFTCQCLQKGYEVDPADASRCIDIDECSAKTDDCSQICHNVPGSFTCSCKNGYKMESDGKTCTDIDECATLNGGCAQFCHNIAGSFTCTCRLGFKANGLACDDIDECANRPCGSYCNNTIGSFYCYCDPGFELKPDKSNCVDIDECKRGIARCRVNSQCLNNQGSYSCPCSQGFKEDGKGSCIASSCPALKAITDGQVSPARCLLAGGNNVNDVCQYSCNLGFKLTKASSTSSICNSDGNWQYQSGSSPACEPIRCSAVVAPSSSTILPKSCTGSGATYKIHCQVYCDGSLSLLGSESATCQASGQMSADLSKSRCVPAATVTCPSDVVATLPSGTKEMTIKMPLFATNTPTSRLSTVPAGALGGTHKYPVGRTLVKIIAKNEAGVAVHCSFAVDVIDREAPNVHNCHNGSYNVEIRGDKGLVTWPVPTFTDNVAVVKQFQNLFVDRVRPAASYFIYYSARDARNNVATCSFFVHVKSKFCSKHRMPGGEGATVFPTSDSAVQLTAFVNCPAGTWQSFDAGVVSYVCTNGDWNPARIPDCVKTSPADASGVCPAGTKKVTIWGTSKCSHCAKGTSYDAAKSDCVDCPVGYYQDQQKSLSCVKCPTGTTTVGKASKQMSQCLAQCIPGSYSKDGFNSVDGCQLCPIGYYQSLHGQNECTLCPNQGVTLQNGTKLESKCIVPARITKILPADELVAAKVGDTVIVDCYASGIPVPNLSIRNATILAPASFRGTAKRLPLTTQDKYTIGLRLEISNVQVGDTSRFICTADNQQQSAGAKDERSFRIEVTNSTW